MKQIFLSLVILSITFSVASGQTAPTTEMATEPTTIPTTGPSDLVGKIQSEVPAALTTEDGKPNPNVPHGEWIKGTFGESPIYPGTDRAYEVYVPAQYDPAKPACFIIRLDSLGPYEGIVLDNLVAKKEIPIMIGIGISSGGVWTAPPGDPKRKPLRMDRSYEFDSMNDHLADYILNEVLPQVQKLKTKDGRAINLSTDGNDHAVTGGSTGGIGSFTLAWHRPDQFTRVYDVIGTFVSMRGGHEYPALIRKTEPKPIRIFLEDGSTDAWNPLFGSWFDANVNMESALSFAGYDVAHAWGTHGHNGKAGAAIFPDVMRWLWRGYPARVQVGTSKNSTLHDILPDNAGWRKVDAEFQDAHALAANAEGEIFLSDAVPLGPGEMSELQPGLVGEAFGPGGTLYGVDAANKKILAMDGKGQPRVVADGIAGRGITVTHDGVIYASEPGEHSDMPSRIWQIKPNGDKKVVDEGLSSVSGIAFSPDGHLFFAAEKTTKWIYSYIVQPDGSLTDKQRYFWLHITDVDNDSGAEDMAVDAHGELYVATRMGVQVCDQNGRVRAILPLPTPCGAVRSLCFGGSHFDTLYATDGKHVFKRTLKSHGFAPATMPTTYPSEGGS